MVNIIQGRPTFGSLAGQALGRGLQSGVEKGMDFAQQLGLQKSRQKTEKLEEKRRGYEVGLGTIEAMKKLAPKMGVTTGLLGLIPGTEASGIVQEYKTYANSLLGVLSTIPVRNQKEFENVKEALANPRASQTEIESAINSAEDILKRHLHSLDGSSEEREPKSKEKTEKKKGKTKFNPKHPEHAAKFNQLNKQHKGDKGKVNEALAREFTL